MNPLETSWVFLKTMSPAERARHKRMTTNRKTLRGAPKPTPSPFPTLQNETNTPDDYNDIANSPNQLIEQQQWLEAQENPPGQQSVTPQDYENWKNPTPPQDPTSGQPTPKRVGPGDMSPEAIMRYTRPQLEQMIQLIHNELTRRQDNKNMGKVGVR